MATAGSFVFSIAQERTRVALALPKQSLAENIRKVLN
jgi:hypothetical protein